MCARTLRMSIIAFIWLNVSESRRRGKILWVLRRSGVCGTANVIASRDTGGKYNEEPVIELTLEVDSEGHSFRVVHPEVVSIRQLKRSIWRQANST